MLAGRGIRGDKIGGVEGVDGAGKPIGMRIEGKKGGGGFLKWIVFSGMRNEG